MIEVAVGKQSNGATFQLHPRTRALLESRLPGWTSVPSSVFVYSNKPWDYEHMQDPMWAQIVMLLTRLNEEQIEELGGFKFISPSDAHVVYESHAA